LTTYAISASITYGKMFSANTPIFKTFNIGDEDLKDDDGVNAGSVITDKDF
jgi:hypothetical protein